MQSLLRHLDCQAISEAAKKETRNREVYLPPISVYRWWARRTAAVNDAILGAAETEQNGKGDLLVLDPFSGGGVVPLVAVLRQQRVYAQDIDPWASAGLAAMLRLPGPEAIREAADALRGLAKGILEEAYRTHFRDGNEAWVSHTIRVAVAECSHCDREQRMFYGGLVTLMRRREQKRHAAFVACKRGHLFRGRADRRSRCPTCSEMADPSESYLPGRTVTCTHCGKEESLAERARNGSWRWEPVLVERADRRRRELDFPTAAEIRQAENDQWKPKRKLGTIPAGREASVLRRHGFSRWEDTYPRRQRHVLERLLALVKKASKDEPVRHALTIAIIGSTEMAGYLSRWDRYYLKSYEAMAAHRFNFTVLPAEPNVWGTRASGRGTVLRRVRQMIKAATWMRKNVKSLPQVVGPRLVRGRKPATPPATRIQVYQGSSEHLALSRASVDLVLTDPPYHDDVHYSELSLPLRAWARLSTRDLHGEVAAASSNGNGRQGGKNEKLLTRIYKEVRRVMKKEGHLVFSYANRDPAAWVELMRAVDTAGFRAAGFAIIHSENEHDHAKRNVRACSLDLLIDLISAKVRRCRLWRPGPIFESEEEKFLLAVGEMFLKIGRLPEKWETGFVESLKEMAFLKTEE